MDEDEGARRSLIQVTKHGIGLSRDQADINRRMAQSYAERAKGVTQLPPEVLKEFEAALRDESKSAIQLADAIAAEAAAR